MSHYDYTVSRALMAQDIPFYAIIMAAMRRADPSNLAKLQHAFPDTWAELDARYYAPNGGQLPGDRIDESIDVTVVLSRQEGD